MSFDIVMVIPIVGISMVLRKVIIRGEQIRKIKERSDLIVGMICGESSIQISNPNN